MPHWEAPGLLFLPALPASASGTKTQGAACRTWGRSFNEICWCLDSCIRSALGSVPGRPELGSPHTLGFGGRPADGCGGSTFRPLPPNPCPSLTGGQQPPNVSPKSCSLTGQAAAFLLRSGKRHSTRNVLSKTTSEATEAKAGGSGNRRCSSLWQVRTEEGL